MTNTPERYDHHEDGMEIAHGGDFVSYDDYAALLARAEQAEARVAELDGALRSIDALDPEASRIEGCGENALRGLVLRMGGIARAALSREKPKP
jgi:hypothetical protein